MSDYLKNIVREKSIEKNVLLPRIRRCIFTSKSSTALLFVGAFLNLICTQELAEPRTSRSKPINPQPLPPSNQVLEPYKSTT